MHYLGMAIKVARGGKVIGEFEAKEIPWRVQQGVLIETDYYWTAGMSDWKPLTELLKKPTIVETKSSGYSLLNLLTFGLFTGWLASGSTGGGDGGDEGGFWSPRPGPMNTEDEDDEETNERLEDIAQDERELMADDDSGDSDYDGDA
jgi:GYF domain 2